MKTHLLYFLLFIFSTFSAFAGEHPLAEENSGSAWSLIFQEGNDPDSESVLSIYPNPFNQSPTIRVNLENRNILSLKVYDLIGKEHFKVDLTNKEGMLRYTPNFAELQPGIYFCSLYDQNGVILTKKLVKVQ